MLFRVLFVFATIHFVSSAVNLSFIQRCSRNDSDLNECIVQKGNIALKTIVNGVSGLDIPTFKPYKLGTIKGKLSSTINLTYDSYAYLSNDLKLYYANIDLKKQKIYLGLELTQLVLDGNLTLNGTLENGKFLAKGKANITYSDPTYQYNATFTVYTKNNTMYARLNSSSMTTKYKNISDVIYNLRFANKITSDQYKILDAELDSNIESVITTGLLFRGKQIITYVYNQVLDVIPLNQIFT